MLSNPLIARRAIALGGLSLFLLLGVCFAWAPGRSTMAVVVAVVLAAMVWRVEWAVLAYVAAEPFSGILQDLSSVSIKMMGLLVFVAWLVRLLTRTWPVRLGHPAVTAVIVFTAVLLASTTLHPHGSAGLTVVSRYGAYLAVLLVLIDTMRSGLAPVRVVRWFVVSCTAAAVVGLVNFFAGGGGRAAGPLTDANDFAFFLVVAVPLAWALWRGEPDHGHVQAHAWVASMLVLTVALLATFSRGALLGLALVLIVAVLTQQVRFRAVVAGALLVAASVGVVAMVAPALVHESLLAKQHIAAQNVDDRFATWQIAAQMTAAAPVLGQGPAGFDVNRGRYDQETAVDVQRFDVAHQTYLEVASELGLLGLATFLAIIGQGLSAALRAAPDQRPQGYLARGICFAFVGALAAATFLTEQYYLPLWLLTALGVVLDPRRGPADHLRRRAMPAPVRFVEVSR